MTNNDHVRTENINEVVYNTRATRSPTLVPTTSAHTHRLPPRIHLSSDALSVHSIHTLGHLHARRVRGESQAATAAKKTASWRSLVGLGANAPLGNFCDEWPNDKKNTEKLCGKYSKLWSRIPKRA